MGAYYTRPDLVNITWEMLAPHLDRKTVVLDSSCGYGGFLEHPQRLAKIGNDVDPMAVAVAKQRLPNAAFFNTNALAGVSRAQYGIRADATLCIIGNPPYNDRTSIIRNRIKSSDVRIDRDIETRDLGMSFLLSYHKLDADVICVLHPLSYLIKPANFSLLHRFARRYRLLDAKIISSATFGEASQVTPFPIVIALYKKIPGGMDYPAIMDFSFSVSGSHSFRLTDFDYIANYVRKYPDKQARARKDSLLFWTMRDINALKRNRTFVNTPSQHTIVIDQRKLDYYMYIDVFKRFARHVPWYFGNCDILIDNALFQHHRRHFILESMANHPPLKPFFPQINPPGKQHLQSSARKIDEYFQRLLGPHYVT